MIQNLIIEWRAQFHAPTLPFVYVELCLGPIWYDVGHMSFWEAQRAATKLPAVGFATTTDIEQMVHAPNKTEVARRLVLEMNRLAQTPTRMPAGPSHGPALLSAVKAAGTVTLTFENSSKDMQVLLGFAACDGYPYQRNAQKQCPGGGKVPTPRVVANSTSDCDGVEGRESPFICDVTYPGMSLPSSGDSYCKLPYVLTAVNRADVYVWSDFYNTSRIPLPYYFDEAAGTVVVDVRRCSVAANRSVRAQALPQKAPYILC